MSGTMDSTARQGAAGARRRNVGTGDRVFSALLGTWMLTGRRRNRSGFGKVIAVASGMMLLQRAATGHSAVYERLGVSSAKLDQGAGITIEEAVTIGRPRTEVHEFMRDPANLPRIFTHLAAVTPGPEGLSHWRLKPAPGRRAVEWDVRVLNDKPGEYISWESVGDSTVQLAGSVHFRDAAEKGTEVHVKLRYRPPGAAWGFGIAKAVNAVTAAQVAEDLRALKQLLEVGAVTTIAGQPSGPPKAQLASGDGRHSTAAVRERAEQPAGALQPPKEPEPVVVRGWELDPEASPEIEGAPVPRAELERVMAGLVGVDDARPVEPVDEDFRGGEQR